MKIIIIICCIALGITASIIGYLLYSYKKKKEKLENEIIILEQEEKNKQESIKIITDNIEVKKLDLEALYKTMADSQVDHQELLKDLSNLNGKIEGAKNQLAALDEISAKNKRQISEAEEQKSQILKSIDEKFQNDLENLIESYENKSEEYEEKLDDLRQKRDAAIQVAINDYESKNGRGFYMLQLSDDDIEDIHTIKKFEQLLHNKEILGKLIYKTYVEKAYTDLVGRVLNKEEFSGIYKITNEINQMCYVGQAANIKKRWQQHIKRAVGAEPLVNNKLYPAMQQYGIENFSFEVVDRCGKDKLNEREQYWQEFYAAKSFGYSIK